jgi:hypothetical protein
MLPPSTTRQPWNFDESVYQDLLRELSAGEKPFY